MARSDGAVQLSSTPSSHTSGSHSQVEDLFSAHDFDIQIDLPTSNEGIVTCIHNTSTIVVDAEKKMYTRTMYTPYCMSVLVHVAMCN